jgi:uncharacterized tellurite resistance protein B-like protein
MSDGPRALAIDPLNGAGPEECFFALLVCAIAVDGSAQKAEREEFSALVRASGQLGPFQHLHRDWLAKHLGAVQGDQGPDVGRVKQLAAAAAPRIPAAWRTTAFTMACDIVFSDAEFADDEQWLIRMLAVAFDLPFQQVRAIVEARTAARRAR